MESKKIKVLETESIMVVTRDSWGVGEELG